MRKRIKRIVSRIPGMQQLLTFRAKVQFDREKWEKKRNYEKNRYVTAKDGVAPLVSIIIVGHDQEEQLKQLMNSFHKCRFYEHFEIVYVDNASIDASAVYMESLKTEYAVTVVHSETEQTFAVANNMGVEYAKGDYLLFLDSASEITDGWLDELLKGIGDRKQVGMVGAKLIYPGLPKNAANACKSYKIESVGIGFRSKCKDGKYNIQPYQLGNGAAQCGPKHGMVERVAVASTVMMISQTTFKEIGGWDENYRNGYEDVDICLRLIKEGYHNYYCANCMVYHYEDGERKDSKRENHNLAVYKGKWQQFLQRVLLGKEALTDDIEWFTNQISTAQPLKMNENEIDICGAMPEDETIKYWGDYHYAVALQREFERRGYRANVLPRDRWYEPSKAKYILVLRGLRPYYPSIEEGKKVIFWNISHPADVDEMEYNLADYVFFASETMRNLMGSKITTASGVLLQCTDEHVMTFKDSNKEKRYDLLFVGNSRHVFRPILKDLLPTPYHLTVYGRHWEEFPIQEYVVSDYIDNEEVGQAYHDAKILLNDHWDDMREYGIISNRIFDALAVGAFVISDAVPGLEEVLQGTVVTYRNREDLQEKIDYYMNHDKEREEKARLGQQIVLRQHTFANRVEKLIEVMENL